MAIFEKDCLRCGRKMYRNKKSEADRNNWLFCNRSCFTAYKNTKRRKPITGYKKCLFCKTLFPFRASLKIRSSNGIASVKQIFCSSKCSLLNRNLNDNPAKKPAVRIKISQSRSRGELAGYGAKHTWVRNEFGHPYKCGCCGKLGEYTGTKWNIHYANISKKYKKIQNDWLPLCAKCHRKFDKKVG